MVSNLALMIAGGIVYPYLVSLVRLTLRLKTALRVWDGGSLSWGLVWLLGPGSCRPMA